MEFKIWRWKISITERFSPNLPINKYWRRNLAHSVDQDVPILYRDLKIERIKSLRNLKQCGLVEAKYWVEMAYYDDGYGRVA